MGAEHELLFRGSFRLGTELSHGEASSRRVFPSEREAAAVVVAVGKKSTRVRLEGCVWKGGSRARLHPHGLKFVFSVIFSSLSPAHTLLKAAHGLAPPVRQKMA
jgi:hypothetical protein